MDVYIIGSVFTSCISITSDSSHEIVIKDCKFSNFDSVSSEVALYLASEGCCCIIRCCFFDIVFQSLVGYSVHAKRAECKDITICNLSHQDPTKEGGVVQCLECIESSLKSVNTTDVMTEHICIASLQKSNISTASFLNAFNLTASIRGVGIQFNKVHEFASLQFANFVKISSPKYGIVRSVNSYIALYASHCYFAHMLQGQKAFYGDSLICVSASSSSQNSIVASSVTIFDNVEIPKSLDINVHTRNVRRSQNLVRKLDIIKVMFSILFILPDCE